MKILLRPVLAGLLLLVPASARDIVDMSGRHVTVPDTVHRAYAMTHAFPLITAIAPDLVAGFASPMPPKPEMMEFLPSGMAGLPNLGGGSDANIEKLKASGIDIAFGWTSKGEQYPVKNLERIAVPVVFIDVDRLAQYPGTFRFLGKLFHREARGEELAKTLDDITARLKKSAAAAKDKPRVYYAESIDGLTSQCEGTDRSEVIALAGGRNALPCNATALSADHYVIDLETLLAIDPEVIVTRFAATAATIKSDPRWARLRAVKIGKVFVVPSYPFNWFDRPPSFLRALGAEWLATKLHPGLYRIDLKAEVRRFHHVFFGTNLTDAQVDKLLSP
jgi:iron complex transport system substrate-binding protein